MTLATAVCSVPSPVALQTLGTSWVRACFLLLLGGPVVRRAGATST